MQLVVCSLRPVRLEGPVHGLGHTRQHGPPKCFRAHGMCDNLINALKLLANLQIDGDGPVKMVVQGLQERSRPRLMDGLRKFIMVENHEAVKVGELDKNVESRKVVKPKFTTDFPEAVVREGADEQTLRADGEGALRTFIDTTNVGDKKRWEPPLVDEDWHAVCQAIFQGVEGSQWETMFCKYVDLHKAANCQKILRNQEGHGALVFGRRKRQRHRLSTIWAVCRRSQVRLDLWAN